MGPTAVPIAIGAAGLGLQVYGMVSGAEAAADARRRQLVLKHAQADEIDARAKINAALIKKQGLSQISRLQTTGEGRGNVGVGFRLESLHNLMEAIDLANRDAAFKASQLRLGADIETGLLGDQLTASYIGAGSTILTGAADIYGTAHKYKKAGG